MLSDDRRPNWVLRIAIHDAGMTQVVLAKRTSVNKATLSGIVTGRVIASPQQKLAIAKALKKDVHALFAVEAMEQAS